MLNQHTGHYPSHMVIEIKVEFSPVLLNRKNKSNALRDKETIKQE